MPAGRPTSYDPSYCERVIEMGREGYSVVEMAAEIGVGRNTLETLWPAANPEFREALTEAREASQAWWEAHHHAAGFRHVSGRSVVPLNGRTIPKGMAREERNRRHRPGWWPA